MANYAVWKKRLKPLISFFFRPRAVGTENVPETGPVILAPNHFSLTDPLITAIMVDRDITFMAKASLFKVPVLGWFMRSIGAVPLKRDGSDFSALRTVLAELKKGKVVAIFPQGRRYKGRKPKAEDLKDGVGFMSMVAKAPVVPVGIYTKRYRGAFFKKNYLSYGEAVRPWETVERDHDSAHKASVMILDRICSEVENAEKLAAEEKKK